MHSLPDIVKAITLNNKLDESRDFATLVQREMVGHLSSGNKDLRDLGVKQAPFVVLIGAGMPSVLAEISFITHSAGRQAPEEQGVPAEDRRGAVSGRRAVSAIAEGREDGRESVGGPS